MGMTPRYKSAKQMQKVIDKYFDSCELKVMLDEEGNAITDRNGNPVYRPSRPPTVTGLALALGFTSRQALLNYQEKEEFVDTVTRAKSRCEMFAEEQLFTKEGANGAKFSLANNFEGWNEKQRIDGSLSVGKLEDLI